MEEFQRIILVHYHEIGLKGRNRGVFEKRLQKNLEALLGAYPVVTIHRISGRLLVFLREGTTLEVANQCTDAILGVPGVARASCGFKCDLDIEVMGRAACIALAEAEPFSSFKVSARRNHTVFPIDSMQMNRDIGEVLCERFPEKRVQMKGQDVTVGVEAVEGTAYVYARSVRGIGGLPVGSSGKVVCLLSSGIDSPVATWRMARRGAVPIGVHFSGRPQTSDASEYLVDDIAHVLERTGCIGRVYVVPFGDYQREISLSCPPSLRVILYRRLMFRVAEELARREGAGALVTGESLGQVTTSAPRTTRWNCRCCGRSSARTSWRSSRRPRSWAPSRSRPWTLRTAARCSCRAIPRPTRNWRRCARPRRLFRLTSGCAPSPMRPSPTTTPARPTSRQRSASRAVPVSSSAANPS